jgi:hypothetical protein
LNQWGFDDNGDEVNFNFEEGNDNDDEQAMEEDNEREGKRSKMDQLTDHGHDHDNTSLGNGQNISNGSNSASIMTMEQREEMGEKIKRMATEIVDRAVCKPDSLIFVLRKFLRKMNGSGYGSGEDDLLSVDDAAVEDQVAGTGCAAHTWTRLGVCW